MRYLIHKIRNWIKLRMMICRGDAFRCRKCKRIMTDGFCDLLGDWECADCMLSEEDRWT